MFKTKANGRDVAIGAVGYVLAHVVLDVIAFAVVRVPASLVWVVFVANAIIALVIAVQLVKVDRKHRRPS